MTWIIRQPGKESLGAFCIVKPEDDIPIALTGKVLKISTFKVSSECLGYRYGELLLKTTFEHAIENRFDWAFVTVFEKHEELIRLLEDFGFQPLDERTPAGELILAKPFSASSEHEAIAGDLDYHIGAWTSSNQIQAR